MTKTYIKVPPVSKREYMNDSYYHQLTSESRFVQLYPGDTHSKWGEIIDAWAAGIKIRITRVKNKLSTSGQTYKVGSIHFIPMERARFSYVTEEEATGLSYISYAQDENLTWAEWQARANLENM